jgi:deoxyadenosine/deoxycytidine kinase
MHIAVAGNIGAGKTTLTGLLAKHFKWEPHYEDVVDNPYLDDFTTRWNAGLLTFKSTFKLAFQPDTTVS